MKKTLMQLRTVAVIAFSCWQLSSVGSAQDQNGATQPKPVPAPVVNQAVDMPLAMNHHPDVFYNHYLPPAMDGTAASMYPAPMPVPARVGQTQYTYQPLLPHEHMYRHSRVYYNSHGTRDMFYSDPCRNRMRGTTYTKTSVIWGWGGNHLTPLPLRLPSLNLKPLKACGKTCR